MKEEEIKKLIWEYLSDLGTIQDESEFIYFDDFDGVIKFHLVDLVCHLCEKYGKDFALHALKESIFPERL